MSIKINNMQDIELSAQRVLIRQDLNVPIKDGKIVSQTRIIASLPTIKLALEKGGKVILMSHLGRPKEGTYDENLSLAPVAACLQEHLGRRVELVKDWLDQGCSASAETIYLLENSRFCVGEKQCDATLSQKMAALCDVFIMDAFGTAHRKEASTYGVAEYAPIACAGLLLQAELTALGRAFLNPKSPIVAIVGGAKVSTKLTLLDSLSQRVDQLVAGGGIANTFIKANGFEVGQSLCETDLATTAKKLMASMNQRNASIPVPVDVVVGKSMDVSEVGVVKHVSEIEADDLILDIGPKSAAVIAQYIKQAGTIIWNGPMGVFEIPAFSQGTKIIAEAIAESSAFSIAGGGDTLAAIEQFKVGSDISYISTGGGAFLEFLENKVLPAVEILQKRSIQ